MKIVIFEDNLERQAAMRDCLQDRFHQFQTEIFADSSEMIPFLEANLPETIAISLDHDLELTTGANGEMVDKGTGRLIADFLAKQVPTCPVIIHTTNSAAAAGMEMALQDAHWQTFRVCPFGDLEWIPTTWFRTMRQAIVGSARRKAADVNN